MTSQLAEHQPSASLPKGRGRGPGGQPASFLPRAGRCPAPDCGEQIDPTHLMCRRHWNLVPKQLRDTVWATWLSGQGAATPEHQRAVREAITAPWNSSRPCSVAGRCAPVPRPAPPRRLTPC
jgi:hypothetical protein